MSFRIKILLPFVLLLTFFAGFIKLYWLPDLVQHEVEKISVHEKGFIELLGTSMTPALLVGDLAEIYGTLEGAIEQKPEWIFITLSDPVGRRLYPLELKDHIHNDQHIELSNKIYLGQQYLGEMVVELDAALIQKRVEEPVAHLELMFLMVLFFLAALCVFFLERWLLRPLRNLQVSAAKLAKGDFNSKLPISKSKDEIGHLIDSFSIMREDLQSRELELKRERNFSKAIIDSAGCIIVVLDRDGKIITFNHTAEVLTGYQAYEVLGEFVFDIFILPEERDKVMSVFINLTSGGFPNEHENYWRTKSGEKIMLSWSNACTEDHSGAVEFVVTIGIDITERHMLQEQVSNVMKNLENVNYTLTSYIEVVDKNVITSTTDIYGTITSVSEAFCKISGYSEEELIGNPHNIVRHPDVPNSLYAEMWQSISAGNTWRGDIKNRRKNGEAYWVDVTIEPGFDEDGVINSYTAVRQDITDRKKVEEMAVTDALTGLYNRRHFDTVFKQEIKRAQRDQKSLVFIMFDVDHFKQYNDTYGHQKGDEVLEAIGKTMSEFLHRPSDFGFRLGGEEFGMLMADMTEDEAYQHAERYRKATERLAIEHEHNSASQFMTISLGVAIMLPGSHISGKEIYKKVDDTLYRAKELGRNQSQTVVIEGDESSDS